MEAALEFYKQHVWRNFGIICGMLVALIAVCVFAIERIPAAGSNRAVLLYKRGGGGRYIRSQKEEGENEKDGPKQVKNDEVHAANT